MKYRAAANHNEHRAILAWCGVDSAGNHWDVVSDSPQTIGAQATAEFIADSLNARFESWRVPETGKDTPAPGLHIGDAFVWGGQIFKITAVYTDGVEYLYEIAGSLLTSYDLITQGYKRVTLVDGGEE